MTDVALVWLRLRLNEGYRFPNQKEFTEGLDTAQHTKSAPRIGGTSHAWTGPQLWDLHLSPQARKLHRITAALNVPNPSAHGHGRASRETSCVRDTTERHEKLTWTTRRVVMRRDLRRWSCT